MPSIETDYPLTNGCVPPDLSAFGTYLLSLAEQEYLRKHNLAISISCNMHDSHGHDYSVNASIANGIWIADFSGSNIVAGSGYSCTATLTYNHVPYPAPDENNITVDSHAVRINPPIVSTEDNQSAIDTIAAGRAASDKRKYLLLEGGIPDNQVGNTDRIAFAIRPKSVMGQPFDQLVETKPVLLYNWAVAIPIPRDNDTIKYYVDMMIFDKRSKVIAGYFPLLMIPNS
ncbi:MAG TPA: hypothetical protein VGJ05_19605 [Fimbriiglobus sp.]|jgi:hypothetical protein